MKKIFAGAFMRALEAGRLPFETIRLFWRNWYSYPVEVNNFHLIIYQRHQGLFARHRDLLAPYVGKISDELVNPRIPGHIEVLIRQGEAFGVSLDEMVNCEVYAECRALTEFARGLVYEGSMIEWWARSLNGKCSATGLNAGAARSSTSTRSMKPTCITLPCMRKPICMSIWTD